MFRISRFVTGIVSISIVVEILIILKKKLLYSKCKEDTGLCVKQDARALLMDAGYDVDKNTASDLNCVLLFPDRGIACISLISGRKPCSYPKCGYLHERTTLLTLGNILNLARKQLDICVYVITSKFLENIIIECRKRGVAVRVVTDKGQAEQANGAPRIQGLLISNGVTVRVSKSVNLMHHKFAMVDRDLLITGSFNWTQQAVCGNYENVIVSSAPHLVQPFRDEFDRIWSALEPNLPT